MLFLLLIPLLFTRGRTGSTTTLYFSSLSLLGSLGSKPKKLAGGFHFPLILLPLSLFIIALARPQWTQEHKEHYASGVDIVIAIDVSLSMNIEDFELKNQLIPRIHAARETAKHFIRNRPSDRIGIVGFAGRPYKVSPITLAHEFLPPLIEREIIISEDVAPGTAIGSAIASASDLIDTTVKDSDTKIVILITDGSSNSGKIAPLQAAELAKELGIKIYTLAIGTEGGRLPGYVMNVPMQEFDTKTLEEIASLTGAEYYRAKDFSALEQSFAEIDKLEKVETKVDSYKEVQEYHYWFSSIGGVILTLLLLHQAMQSRQS